MSQRIALEVMRSANGCNSCFEELGCGLERTTYGVPKPRWIGDRYLESTPRVVIALINPGASRDDEFRRNEFRLFNSFYEGGDYSQLQNYFRSRSREPVFHWYQRAFGLDFEEVAQINIAWCATKRDKYPTRMLRNCFAKHTARLLNALEPHAVILSGSAIHKFEDVIRRTMPAVEVCCTLHYAHRQKGSANEASEMQRVRPWLDDIRQRLAPPNSAMRNRTARA